MPLSYPLSIEGMMSNPNTPLNYTRRIEWYQITKATEVCIIEGGEVMSREESENLNDGNFKAQRKFFTHSTLITTHNSYWCYAIFLYYTAYCNVCWIEPSLWKESFGLQSTFIQNFCKITQYSPLYCHFLSEICELFLSEELFRRSSYDIFCFENLSIDSTLQKL